MIKKICPVCDREMSSAHYCKTCRSWVRNPIVKDVTYYLNERHTREETNCTYHDSTPPVGRPTIYDSKAGTKTQKTARQPQKPGTQKSPNGTPVQRPQQSNGWQTRQMPGMNSGQRQTGQSQTGQAQQNSQNQRPVTTTRSAARKRRNWFSIIVIAFLIINSLGSVIAGTARNFYDGYYEVSISKLKEVPNE